MTGKHLYDFLMNVISRDPAYRDLPVKLEMTDGEISPSDDNRGADWAFACTEYDNGVAICLTRSDIVDTNAGELADALAKYPEYHNRPVRVEEHESNVNHSPCIASAIKRADGRLCAILLTRTDR
jgi:hypothetical protein